MTRISISSSFSIFLVFLINVVLVSSVSGRIKWGDCGTTVNILGLRISECDTQPCVFYEKKQYRLEFDAVPKAPSKSLPYTVKADFLFKWTLLAGDACDELSNGTCPIAADGQPFTFFKDFSVDIPIPGVTTFRTTITAEMKDDFGKTLLCADLDVVIKDAKLDPNPTPTVQPIEKPSFVQGFFNFFRS